MAEPRKFPELEREEDLEKALRGLVCPRCAAPRGDGCHYDRAFAAGNLTRYSHTGRYDHAARRGLVPAMAGVR